MRPLFFAVTLVCGVLWSTRPATAQEVTEATAEPPQDTPPTAADERVETGAPTRMSFGPGDFGQQPEATPQTRGMLSARAGLQIDTPNLAGQILLDTQIRASYVFLPRFWANLNLSAIEYRDVINASLTATNLALGPLTGSVHYQAVQSDTLSVAPYVRVLLPTSTALTYGRQVGIELGVSGVYELHPWVSFLWGAMMPVSTTVLVQRTTTFFWPTVVGEIGFHPLHWLEILGGLEIRLGIDPKGALEYVAPKAALRFYPVRGLVIEAKGMFPEGGVEKTHIVGGLSLGWVFGR